MPTKINKDFTPFMGVQIYESAHALSSHEIPIEKNWVQRVIEWNPCNPRGPDFETVYEPTSYRVDDKLICHPSIIKNLREMT